MKRTLVIGNGFDLDVGLKTSYGDFIKSGYWPFNHYAKVENIDTLASFLKRKSQLNTWFDVEEALYEYAKKGGIEEKDLKYFETLKSSLTSYLLDQENGFTQNSNSTAIAVLNALLTCGEQTKIYSFNYTDLRKIASRYAITEDFSCEHMHGTTLNNDIILGIGDKSDINSHYFYFKKVASPNFSSHSIIPDMISSDEVIIFGHSLGLNDHPYFVPYINSLLDYTTITEKRRTITIFTRNESDKQELKKKLEELTGNRVTLLYSLNQINIFCTDGSESSNIWAYLKSINKDWQ